MGRFHSRAHVGELPPLKRPVFGYAANDNQRLRLVEAGLDPADIFTEGDGAESLDAAIAMYRVPGGTLVLALDGKTLGETKAAVLAAQQRIEDAGVALFDVVSMATKSLTQLCTHALYEVASFGRIRGRRTARRIGKRGGEAKAAAMKALREATVPDGVIYRLLAYPGMTLRKAAEILGPPFSPATLMRHYKV